MKIKNTMLVFFFCMTLVNLQTWAKQPVFPEPKQVQTSSGSMILPENITIACDSASVAPAQCLINKMQRFVSQKPSVENSKNATITLAVDHAIKWLNGYILTITPEAIKITGQSTQGVYAGVQSLLWLVRDANQRLTPQQKLELPCLTIRDWPDLQVRGLTLQWCFGAPTKEMMYDTADALAALKYNIIIPEFGPMLVSDRQRKLFTAKTWINRDEFRKFVRYAQAQGLEVVPSLNSLGHGERGMPWPVKLGDGLDMGSEENYKALFDVLEEYIEDCPGVRYIHLGMDESSACLAENSKKYNKPADEMLANHINRLAKFCKEHNVTPVIYHDMLLGADEKIYWREGVAHGTELKSYLARPKIDHDIIVTYWNYEPFSRYRTVEEIQKEGFKFWLMPWGGQTVFTMSQNAYTIGAGVIGSTWANMDYTDYLTAEGFKTLNCIYTLPWLADAIVNLSQASWSVKSPTTPHYDPSLVYSLLHWDRPNYAPAEKFSSLPLSATNPAASDLTKKIMSQFHLKSGRQYLKSMPFEIDPSKVLALGNFQTLTKKELSAIMAQPKPWTLYVDGKADRKIDAINVPREQDKVVLYTRDNGLTTGTSGYGKEVNIRFGYTHYASEWGVGDMSIPRNGYVLSAHGEGLYSCNLMNGYHEVKIIDAAGKEVALGKRQPAGPSEATVAIDRKAKKLIFLQTTAFEAAHYMPSVATLDIRYEDGTRSTIDLCYGRDICSYDDVSFLYGKKNKWIAASTPGRSPNDGKLLYAWEWENPSPTKKIISVSIKASELGQQIGYLLLGLTAIE
jgi:hypothetical protein